MPEFSVARVWIAREAFIAAVAILTALAAACAPLDDAGSVPPPVLPAPPAGGSATTDVPPARPATEQEIDITPVPGASPAAPLAKCTTHAPPGPALTCPEFGRGGTSVLSFSPDGRFLATAGPNWVDVWEIGASGLIPAGRIMGIGSGQLRGAFSPDGRFIATLASSSGTVQLRSFPDLALRKEFRGLQAVAGSGAGVGFSADGTHVIASDGQSVRVWRSDGLAQGGHSLPAARPRAFAISPRPALSEGPRGPSARTPSGQVAFDDPALNQLVLLNLDTGSRNIHQFHTTILSLAFSADGSELAVGLMGKHTTHHTVGGEIVRLSLRGEGEAMIPIGSDSVAGREALELSYSETNNLLLGVFGSGVGTGLPGDGDGLIQIVSGTAPRLRAGRPLPSAGGAVAFAKGGTAVAYRLINDCANVTFCQE